jgi:hypothetical protein
MKKDPYNLEGTGLGDAGLLKSWLERVGSHEGWGDKRRIGIPAIILFAVLGLLVLATFIFYMARLSSVNSGGAGSERGPYEQPYAQLNLELPPPLNISVTVDKGATVRWSGSDDQRILGYNVYRYKGEDDPGSKINSSIISDTVYHDDEGTMFDSYAVAPVDSNGRQGVVSIPVAAVSEPSSLGYGLTPTQQPQRIKDKVFEASPDQPALPANTIGCTGAGMTYQGEWYLEHYAEVMGGALMVTPYYGGYCSYAFSGDSVTVISTRHWNYGIMEIYIDGTLRKEVDLYSSELKVSDRVYTAQGLGPGVHTIKMACAGRKNPQAYFTFIDVEALEIR